MITLQYTLTLPDDDDMSSKHHAIAVVIPGEIRLQESRQAPLDNSFVKQVVLVV